MLPAIALRSSSRLGALMQLSRFPVPAPEVRDQPAYVQGAAEGDPPQDLGCSSQVQLLALSQRMASMHEQRLSDVVSARTGIRPWPQRHSEQQAHHLALTMYAHFLHDTLYMIACRFRCKLQLVRDAFERHSLGK